MESWVRGEKKRERQSVEVESEADIVIQNTGTFIRHQETKKTSEKTNMQNKKPQIKR